MLFLSITTETTAVFAQTVPLPEPNNTPSTVKLQSTGKPLAATPHNNNDDSSNKDLHIHKNALQMIITTRIVDGGAENQSNNWFKECEKITIPGKPVGLKIVGDDIALALFFTAYPQQNGRGILVAQGQVWIQGEDGSVQYKSTMQSVPLKLGETVLFYPLGEGNAMDTKIEIKVSVSAQNKEDEE